ncbi:hypothetical protein FACS189491_06500 [Spirochaetia bacterium]|nr:hypothetical protein FACS189491_06500 [Spirochaetia bacterium]
MAVMHNRKNYFKKIVKKILKLQSDVNKRLNYYRFKAKKENAEKSVLFDFTVLSIRKLYQIISQFLYCGYACYFDLSFKQFNEVNALDYGRKIFKLKALYSLKKNKKSYSIVVSDSQSVLDKYNNVPLKIFINFKTCREIENVRDIDLFYPIISHPLFSVPQIEQEILDCASNTGRKIAVLFAGAVRKDYAKDITKKLFGFTRLEIFTYLEQSLPDNMLYLPVSLDDLLNKMENNELINKVVLINTEIFQIPPNLYFEILLKSDFFIHMPGETHPYCHNQIESMLAGCIPVTSYNYLFLPHFEHEKNSLLFNSFDELTSILHDIIVNQTYHTLLPLLRKNIIRYYNNVYSFESFKIKLLRLKEERIPFANYYINPMIQYLK